MSDTTSPNDDVVRWQQEKDLGHPLNHDKKSFQDQRSGKDREPRRGEDGGKDGGSAIDDE